MAGIIQAARDFFRSAPATAASGTNTPVGFDSGYGGIGRPPGPSRGVVARLRETVGGWIGPRLSRGVASLHRRVTEERAAGGPRGIIFPWFLPYIDDPTGETAAARAAYRLMLGDPNVKAALLGKIFAVASLTPKIIPASKTNQTDKRVADFVEWTLTRRLRGGMADLVWSILSGGLVDGYSVNEKVWSYQTRGKWTGQYGLKALKTKKVGDDVILQTDEYQNIVGVMGLRYNAGMEFSPSDFIIWRHLPMYQSPTGMSDLRAVYSRYWLLDAALKLRAIGVEKRSMPVLWGSYKDPTQQSALESVLSRVRMQSWFSVPEGARVEALNIAGQSDTIFKSTIDDLREEIFLGIQGATLQALTGGQGEQRGSSDVHKDTKQLQEWFLNEGIKVVLNDEDEGLIRDIVDLNFMVSEYPFATFEAVDPQSLASEFQIDQGLNQLGLDLSREELYERYGRQPPKSDQDRVPGQQSPGGGSPGGDSDSGLGGLFGAPGDGAGLMDGGQPEPDQGQQDQGGEPADDAGVSDFLAGAALDAHHTDEASTENVMANSENLQQFCDKGKNKGKPGPCPEDKVSKGKACRQAYALRAQRQVIPTVAAAAAKAAAKGVAGATKNVVTAPLETAKSVASGAVSAGKAVVKHGVMGAIQGGAIAAVGRAAEAVHQEALKAVADAHPSVKARVDQVAAKMQQAAVNLAHNLPVAAVDAAAGLMVAYTSKAHITETIRNNDPVFHGFAGTVLNATAKIAAIVAHKIKQAFSGDESGHAETFADADAASVGFTPDQLVEAVIGLMKAFQREARVEFPLPTREQILAGVQGDAVGATKNADRPAVADRGEILARAMASAWNKRQDVLGRDEAQAAGRALRGTGWIVRRGPDGWAAEKLAAKAS